MVPHFLSCGDQEHLEADFELEEEGSRGFISNPGAVQLLLRMYATGHMIEVVVETIVNFPYKLDEMEVASPSHLRKVARSYGAVFAELDLIRRFVRGS